MKFKKYSQQDLNELLDLFNRGEYISHTSSVYQKQIVFSNIAMQITSHLNNVYHEPEEINKLFSLLIGKQLDNSFRLFPPFYTNFGKNINIGKNVFINQCCHFQDQGGITLSDGVFVGPNCVFATLNHDLNVANRASVIPKPIFVGKNVWFGASCTILPGVTIGDNSIIGAGSVVVKDVPANSIHVGNPNKLVKQI